MQALADFRGGEAFGQQFQDVDLAPSELSGIFLLEFAVAAYAINHDL